MRSAISLAAGVLLVAAGAARGQTVLFREEFEDDLFGSRGWYDDLGVAITTAEHIPGSGAAAEFRFLPGATKAGGAMRYTFAETESFYLSYWVKYSAGWEGSNRPYHPHEFNVVTNLDGRYIGPAHTHLTLYIEQNEGRPLLAIQDGENIDRSRVGQDLTSITEERAVAGCNGDGDGHGEGDCYLSGGVHRNGKRWMADTVCFSDKPGEFYKNDWHFVEAYFKLNSVVDGRGAPDGVIFYRFDGVTLFEYHNVMLRTGRHPDMKFNQLLMAPYIGDGSPVDQTMWVDDLTVATGPVSTSAVALPGPSTDEQADLLTDVEVALDPAASLLTVDAEPAGVKIVSISLIDAAGRERAGWRKEGSGGPVHLDIADYPSGIYFCRIATSLGRIVRPVVVAR